MTELKRHYKDHLIISHRSQATKTKKESKMVAKYRQGERNLTKTCHHPSQQHLNHRTISIPNISLSISLEHVFPSLNQPCIFLFPPRLNLLLANCSPPMSSVRIGWTVITFAMRAVAALLRAICLVIDVTAAAAVPKRAFYKVDQNARILGLLARAMTRADAEGGV